MELADALLKQILIALACACPQRRVVVMHALCAIHAVKSSERLATFRATLETEDLEDAGAARSSAKVGAERGKLLVRINKEMERIGKELSDSVEKGDSICKSIEEMNTDGNVSGGEDLLEKYKASKECVTVHYETLRSAFQSVLDNAGKVADVHELQLVRHEFVQAKKSAKNSSPMKDHRTMLKKLGEFLQEAQRFPQTTKMMSVFARLGGNYNVGSEFESKAGLKPAKTDPRNGEEAATTVQALACVKCALKSVRRDLLNKEMVLFSISDAASAKKLHAKLRKVYGPSMLTSQTLPKDQDWSSKVYMKQVFGAQANWVPSGNASHVRHGSAHLVLRQGSRYWFPIRRHIRNQRQRKKNVACGCFSR